MRQSKYIWGAIEAPKAQTGVGCGEENFFLILDFKMAICGEFLVQCLAVQLKL